MQFVYETIGLIVLVFSGSITGQAGYQVKQPNKAFSAIALMVVASAIGWGGVLYFLFPTATMFDYVAWVVAYAIGIFLGIKEQLKKA